MTQPDPFNLIISNINSLLDADRSTFVAMGRTMFGGLATIMISWFGVRTALSGEGFNFGRFAQLLLLISFGFGMVTYYSTPIPGMGRSFSAIVVDEGQALSADIGAQQAQFIETRLTAMEAGLPQPSSVNLHEVLSYLVVYITIAVVQAAVFMVIAFGLLAQAILVLVGPVFIPFFIVPQLEFLFWGWFKSFLQYTFYQVIANAFVFVFAKVLLAFLGAYPANLSMEDLLTDLPALFIILLISIYGLLKVPSLTNSLFSGSSGEHAIPFAGRVA
jgi:TrbL/VirB6 plasmid conjugal transfer protein